MEKDGLLIVPRVTDMHNGLFRPEVAWSKGKHSDIVLGRESFSTKLRAEIGAVQAAALVFMTQAQADSIWDETARSIGNCQRMFEALLGQIY